MFSAAFAMFVELGFADTLELAYHGGHIDNEHATLTAPKENWDLQLLVGRRSSCCPCSSMRFVGKNSLFGGQGQGQDLFATTGCSSFCNEALLRRLKGIPGGTDDEVLEELLRTAKGLRGVVDEDIQYVLVIARAINYTRNALRIIDSRQTFQRRPNVVGSEIATGSGNKWLWDTEKE
ncbi:hypothetical protein CAPTEDRAFT_184877 [Capitella teleta]|uniref:Uncharacterized protein n=1 Tax=Capitella teleta TaxID=283909 RepID=X1ZH72_CAPTE|nr:hypothetical protein CAPTEDRAFT_184877 [Capitella teleta]|eukprot:ELT90091.1 hypothetical protein CAPTEDRAFT_184877 [Capitella teleta]